MSLTASTPGGSAQHLTGQISYDRVIAPPLPASTDNLNPRGFVNSSGIYLIAPSAADITGLDGGRPARRVTLVNVGAATITLKANDGASLLGNRFIFAADVALTPSAPLIDLEWSPQYNGWIPVSAPGSGGGSGTFTNLTVTGTASFGGAIIESGIVTTPLTGDETLFAPAGISACSTLRINPDAAWSIEGFGMDDASSMDGRRLRLINIGAFDITLMHADADPPAINRILCPGSADFTLVTNGSCTIWYDTTSQRWRVLP